MERSAQVVLCLHSGGGSTQGTLVVGCEYIVGALSLVSASSVDNISENGRSHHHHNLQILQLAIALSPC